MHDELARVLFTSEQIVAAIQRLGEAITRDHADGDLHVIGVLRGCAIFMTHLIQQIELPLTIDFLGLTSYSTSPASGVVRITKDLDESIVDRHVLVVEGIVDTGLTLSYVLRNLATRQPASLQVCALLDKRARRLIEVPLPYVGFECPDEFVVGWGLDWRQHYRNLPCIGVLKQERLEA